MAVHIRPLEAQDHAHWLRLWAIYLDYYETELADEVSATTWQRLLSADYPHINGLIAVENGTPVGMVHFVFHASTWEVSDVCYLEDLVVEPEARGNSYGRALIEAVYAAADAAGCPEVYWLTQHFNETGRRLYDRVGELTPFIRYDRPG
ncbi:MAG: GNAT family N-acetyltransferase [Halieaceae bacterium]|jgi:GNAT superfamily N-acetyltransferase|nr:GNAT family N-acetyltransferase [Halieaceae bacterium]